MKNQKIEKLIQRRILVLDGAMGTMIQKYRLSEQDYSSVRFAGHSNSLLGCNDILNLTKPELIEAIHREYVIAGADIIETNTFNANKISLLDYGLENHIYEINRAGADIAVRVARELSLAGSPVFVAGSIGPTNRSASMSSDVSDPVSRNVEFCELVLAYEEQVLALVDGGCDLLLVETVFDTLNAKAALFAIQNVFEAKSAILPVMLSLTIADAAGRTLSGQTLEAFLTSVSHFPLFSLGLNCALGAEQMTPFLSALSEISPFYLSVYPNAGLPNHQGGYDETAEEMASIVKQWIDAGYVNIVGGCCGTTPYHIKLMKSLVLDAIPRVIAKRSNVCQLSGLELLSIPEYSNLITIGERTNMSGSLKFARLIREKKYEEAASIARQQIENGAQIIDINLDDGLHDSRTEMIHFLRLLGSDPYVCRVPFMIDSAHWSVIDAALQNVQGKCIVNSISLKDGEDEFLRKAMLLKKYGAAVVVMAFDETGQAVDYESKILVCRRAYTILTEMARFNPSEIIFDCNILTIGTGIQEHQNYALDFLKSVQWIKKNIPDVLTSGGVSNLSFAFRGNNFLRETLHSVFLYHAAQEGLDMAIVNAGVLPTYDDIDTHLRQLCTDLILNRSEHATERLVNYVSGLEEKPILLSDVNSWRNLQTNERLIHAIVHGLSEYLESDLTEALKENAYAVNIVEGPLMTAMKNVGQLFGSGKMFLPQVMKSAGVMKKAVNILQPLIQLQIEEDGNFSSTGKILLATVKGDVHDIGKNIAAVVLSCNNFEIIDIGIMVPAAEIIKQAIEKKADIIGLSGLITPSLNEMVNVALKMEEHKLKIPLLIGGATTSEVHTALKIDPVYSGSVVYVKDASMSVSIAADLVNERNREGIIAAYKNKYRKIRENYSESTIQTEALSLREAQANRFIWTEESSLIKEPINLGVQRFQSTPEVISTFINWSYFFRQWRINGKFPDIFNHPDRGEEARKLYVDARKMLKRIAKEQLISIKGVFGIFQAYSQKDDVIVIFENGSDETLHFLRDCSRKKPGERNLCLSDFIAPAESKVKDFIGLFAVSAFLSDNLKFEDEYSETMIKILADRLAEASAEFLFCDIRKRCWGYDPDEQLSIEQLFHSKYRGIRCSPGYPACPDHSEKETIFKILNVEENAGIQLSETTAMIPSSSVCGCFFSHPKSSLFSIDKIGTEQLKEYAMRKNLSFLDAEKLIRETLNLSI